MREKLKPYKFLIIGILVITAFVRGTMMDIALGVLFGVYLVYSGIKHFRKRRNPKGRTYTVILEPKSGDSLKKTKKGKIKKILFSIVFMICYGIYLVYSGIKSVLKKRKPKVKTDKAVIEYKGNSALNYVRIFGLGRVIENAVNKIIR